MLVMLMEIQKELLLVVEKVIVLVCLLEQMKDSL